ncbi:MAG: SCO1664 family protein [Anaerolineales bacterium]|nr:SCO1664 family protein [Anaerolineales bacterium]
MDSTKPTFGKLKAALQEGEIELQGQFLLGSNYTFLVTVHHEGAEIPAVYKPQRGENPLWDFPEASLAGREVAAYLVSEALGFGFVPLTVLRDGPFGRGSLQQFIDYNPNYHYFTFTPADRLRLRPAALFDLLVNNADRKGSHFLICEAPTRQKRTRRLYLIDHGLCFHEEDKLRTVLWNYAGEAIAEDLLSALSVFRSTLSPTGSLHPALEPYLSLNEITALASRTERLLANPIFPHPPEDRRAFPYPPL